MVSVNLDGWVMLCPYGNIVIGTIDDMPTAGLLDSYIPEKCNSCEFWSICRCSCVASATELDCYVNRKMIPKVRELIRSHRLEEEVESLFRDGSI